MVKNDICLGGASKQNALFSKKGAQKNAPMPSLSRIGPACNFRILRFHRTLRLVTFFLFIMRVTFYLLHNTTCKFLTIMIMFPAYVILSHENIDCTYPK